MKTRIEEYNVNTKEFYLYLHLKSVLTDQSTGDTSEADAPVEILDTLQVELTKPRVSGEMVLTTEEELQEYYTIDGSEVDVILKDLQEGQYVVTLKARLGTAIFVVFQAYINVTANPKEGSQDADEDVVVYEGMGDGYTGLVIDATPTEDSTNPIQSGGVYAALEGKQPVGNYADGAVYGKDGDGNAHITKPLSISGSVQEGNHYGEVEELNVVVLTPEQKAEVEAVTGTAYDYCDTNDNITDGVNVTIYADEECTQKVGSTAKTEYAESSINGDFFNLQDGESILAGTYYARVERGTLGDNSHAEGSGTTASGDSSHAEGNSTTASGGGSHAEGDGTTASGGNSHAEGVGTIASQYNQHVSGKYNVEDTNGDYALIVGNGEDDQNRSNAFAIDWNGNLVLFNAGTPVVLTPAKLATLIV